MHILYEDLFLFMHMCERMGMIVWVCVCICECVCGCLPHAWTCCGQSCPFKLNLLHAWSEHHWEWRGGMTRPESAEVPHLVFLLRPFQVELEFKLLDGKSRGKLPHCILRPKAKMPQLTWLLGKCLLLWRSLLLLSKTAGVCRQDVVLVLKNPFLWTLVATPGRWIHKCSPNWLE